VELTGKVISFLMAISMCAQPVGQALYGVLFEQLIDLPWIVVLGSAGISAIIAVYSKATFKMIDTRPVRSIKVNEVSVGNGES